jgi:hypothetical protein
MMPDGCLAITSLNCEDNDRREVDLCQQIQFELGREFLAEPSNVDAYTTVAELGSNWRLLVHFSDWVKWNEPLPLEPCHCVDVSELPRDRSRRDDWVLKGHRVVVKADA